MPSIDDPAIVELKKPTWISLAHELIHWIREVSSEEQQKESDEDVKKDISGWKNLEEAETVAFGRTERGGHPLTRDITENTLLESVGLPIRFGYDGDVNSILRMITDGDEKEFVTEKIWNMFRFKGHGQDVDITPVFEQNLNTLKTNKQYQDRIVQVYDKNYLAQRNKELAAAAVKAKADDLALQRKQQKFTESKSSRTKAALMGLKRPIEKALGNIEEYKRLAGSQGQVGFLERLRPNDKGLVETLLGLESPEQKAYVAKRSDMEIELLRDLSGQPLEVQRRLTGIKKKRNVGKKKRKPSLK